MIIYLIFFIVFVFLIYKANEGTISKITNTVYSILFSFVFSTFSFVLYSSIFCFISNPEITGDKNIIEINSLNDNFSPSGSFFLTLGSIESKSYYFYYYKDEEGYKMGKSNMSNTVINYLDDSLKKPYFYYLNNIRFKNKNLNWWALPTRLDRSKKYFYIPKGSIKEYYNLDTK